ncbi:MAG: toxin-antitoxin system HicB family antitoxin [Methylotenera sp.]
MNFDPEAYTLTIRKELIDNELIYVGKVAELPDVVAFEDTYEEAHQILLDTISSLQEIADEQNRTFPAPFETEDEYSGRVTLRFTKSLHKSASLMAEREGVSLNQFLNTIVAEAVGERKVKVSNMAMAQLAGTNIITISGIAQRKPQHYQAASTASQSSEYIPTGLLSKMVN